MTFVRPGEEKEGKGAEGESVVSFPSAGRRLFGAASGLESRRAQGSRAPALAAKGREEQGSRQHLSANAILPEVRGKVARA